MVISEPLCDTRWTNCPFQAINFKIIKLQCLLLRYNYDSYQTGKMVGVFLVIYSSVNYTRPLYYISTTSRNE